MKFVIKAIGGGKYNFGNPKIIEIISCCTRHAVEDADKDVRVEKLVFYNIKPHISTTKECSGKSNNDSFRKIRV